MLQPNLTEEEIVPYLSAIHGTSFRAAKKKLNVVYLKALELSHQEIVCIARVSADSAHAICRRMSNAVCVWASLLHPSVIAREVPLLPHSEVLKTRFQAHPPHTVAEAAYEFEKLTGIQLALSACHDFIHKHLGMRYRKIFDFGHNACYQRCDKVINKASELGIDLQFLPPYSPNLNLIERLWKFTKKQCLYNRYREPFC